MRSLACFNKGIPLVTTAPVSFSDRVSPLPADYPEVSPSAVIESKPSPATTLTTSGTDAVVPLIALELSPEMTEVHDADLRAGRATFGTRAACIAVIVLPVLGLLAAIALLWGPGVQPVHLWLMVGGYVFTGLGITVGYHRLFTHKSFKTNRFMTAFWAILGSSALEGPVLRWVGMHRLHHQHSDHDLDPHSPHLHEGKTMVDMLKGVWHSHMGWIMFACPVDLNKYTPDLRKDKMLLFIDRTFGWWVLLGLIIPGIIAYAVTGTFVGGLLGVLWGGFARIFIVHHITWSINSACHLWGKQHFRSHDESRNNALFGVLGLGEGWHNNHHAFPASARHGLRWYQFDLSWMVIKGMSLIGLAHDLNVPSKERQAAKAVA